MEDVRRLPTSEREESSLTWRLFRQAFTAYILNDPVENF